MEILAWKKFATDPCAEPTNRLGCRIFYTKQDDGLTKPWYGNVFINPPYGLPVRAWIKAALEYNRQTGNTVVMLLKATTDVSWFHDYIYQKPNVEVRFLKGKLHFVDVNGQRLKNAAPFASMLVVIRGIEEEEEEEEEDHMAKPPRGVVGIAS